MYLVARTLLPVSQPLELRHTNWCGRSGPNWNRQIKLSVRGAGRRTREVRIKEIFDGTGRKIIGIDLGTTNSVVAVMEGSEPTVIPNPEGNRLTPSVVAFTDKGEILVGELARRQAVTNPTKTIYSVKRFMGRRHDEVHSEEKMVPYGVTGGQSEYVKVKVGDKEYTPQEISARTLGKLKEAPNRIWDTKSTRP